MLRRLIKHEFKATGRLFLPMFAIVIVLTPILSGLFRFTRSFNDVNPIPSMIGGLSMISAVLLLVATFIAVYIFIAMRFYRTVGTSEAYLTFCLPVKSRQILTSKLIVAFVWQVLSFIVLAGAIYLMLVVAGALTPGDIFHMFFYRIYNSLPPVEGHTAEYAEAIWFLVRFGLTFLIQLLAGILQIYLAVALGQLFNEHRVVASIGMFVGLYTVIQILSVFITMPWMVSGGSVVQTAYGVTYYTDNYRMVSTVLNIAGVMYIILAVVFFIITSWILKKKVNVR